MPQKWPNTYKSHFHPRPSLCGLQQIQHTSLVIFQELYSHIFIESCSLLQAIKSRDPAFRRNEK